MIWGLAGAVLAMVLGPVGQIVAVERDWRWPELTGLLAGFTVAVVVCWGALYAIEGSEMWG